MGTWDLQQRLGLAQSTSTPHLAASRKVPSGRRIFPKRADSELSRNFALTRLPGKQNPGAHPSKMPCLSPFHFDLAPMALLELPHLKSPPNNPPLLPASMWDPCTPTFWEWGGAERFCLPAEASIALLAVLLPAIQEDWIPFGTQALPYLCRSAIAASSLLCSWAGESEGGSFFIPALAPEGLACVQFSPWL